MLIYLSLIIPILTGIIILYFFKHKANWWEPLIAFGITFLFIFLFKWGVESSQTDDVEYWGGLVQKAEYYEEWDEWIEQTCSSTCCCDSKGENCTTTYYDCSYRRYHSPEWIITDNNGHTWSITENFYNQLKSRWGNKQTFVELNRDYYRMDGNKYEIYWNKKEETAEITSKKYDYENRVQASHNVINYPEVDASQIRRYKLYEYPKIENWSQNSIIGSGGFNYYSGLKKLNYLNGLLGQSKRLRTYTLLFKNQSNKAAQLQEFYWKGGNKNEFIICIGLDKEDKIIWTHVFSWTKAEQPKIEIRDYLLLNKEQKNKLDLLKYADFCFVTLQKEYEHRSFKEFDYLTIEPKPIHITWCFIIVLIINIGMGIFIVRKDYN